MASLELWGGVECTHNRVGNSYFDQLDRTGHSTREGDLERFADLGLRTLRYPILWERIAPQGLANADWSWSDKRLATIRTLGMEPIIGLTHHGSGPRYTNLLDPNFPLHLAYYAQAVAERYPWTKYFTPVNEPLTTARFSGLYGYWYPHAQDNYIWARILLNECRAVALAMQRIKTIIPNARLVQTEDIGKVHSTPTLTYQADFENERRWLTFDLLCGHVDREHAMWGFLRWIGISERELMWFLEHPCPPDVLGINYYVTSERFLDDDLTYYPVCTHGGNGKHAYADVEAVRVLENEPISIRTLLKEAASRYTIPLALTEIHLACNAEEDQARWLLERWKDALSAKESGVDIRALTVWSLLGAYDWDSLVTQNQGHYEPGVFDISTSETPVPTLLAELVRDLTYRRTTNYWWQETPGWWQRPDRILYPSREKSIVR